MVTGQDSAGLWRGQGGDTSGDTVGTATLAAFQALKVTLTFASPPGKAYFVRCVEVRLTRGALSEFQGCSLHVYGRETRVHARE